MTYIIEAAADQFVKGKISVNDLYLIADAATSITECKNSQIKANQ